MSTEESSPTEVVLIDHDYVLDAVINNDLVKIQFIYGEDPASEQPPPEMGEEEILELIQTRDAWDGKSPLDMASILGRTQIVQYLITKEIDLSSASKKGYTALHHAAAWGKLDVIKALVEGNANMQLRTAHGERPREISIRYRQNEVTEYLEWAEAKQALVETIKTMRETLQDPEKVQGKLSKEDKVYCNGACNEKDNWLEQNPEATTGEYVSMKVQLDDTLSPIWMKLNEAQFRKSSRQEKSAKRPDSRISTKSSGRGTKGRKTPRD